MYPTETKYAGPVNANSRRHVRADGIFTER
jgi:hypothetical protein